MENDDSIKDALGVLREAFKDKHYYLGWQANIAMAYQDEAARQETKDSRKKLQSISNQAAKNFINLLTMEITDEN